MHRSSPRRLWSRLGRPIHPARSVAALTVAVAVAMALLPAGIGRADPNGDKNRVDHQLAETQATLEAATERAQQAATQYTSATAALPAAEAASAQARGQYLGAQAAAREADRAVQRARDTAAAAGQAYDASAVQVEGARAQVTAFVTAAYKGGGFLMLNAILESGSPNDFASRMAYLDSISKDQERALGELTAARMVAKQQSDIADAARAAADQAATAAQAALQAALDAQAAADRSAAALRSLADQQAQALAVANDERAATLARYNELRAESDRVAAELRAAARSGGSRGRVVPDPKPGAFFLMPVDGWKSSNFGMRYDPYYGVWQLHAGTDFAAAGGQPIWAASDGVVVRTGWYGGYGNYTCVSHGTYQGRGIATCYGHQSQILVAPGQAVRRGQVIGLVGTTGASTGYHLHFEVRLDGVPVDPLGWLPSCLC